MIHLPPRPVFKVGDLVVWRDNSSDFIRVHGSGPFVVLGLVEGLSPEVRPAVKIQGRIGEIVMGSGFFVLAPKSNERGEKK